MNKEKLRSIQEEILANACSFAKRIAPIFSLLRLYWIDFNQSKEYIPTKEDIIKLIHKNVLQLELAPEGYIVSTGRIRLGYEPVYGFNQDTKQDEIADWCPILEFTLWGLEEVNSKNI